MEGCGRGWRGKLCNYILIKKLNCKTSKIKIIWMRKKNPEFTVKVTSQVWNPIHYVV